MSMLRNLEAKLGGLVEGAFGRAFRTSVQPVELAHKLAKEMEDNQMASVSRVYVPNHYRVFLSPKDREQFASYEPALRKELSDYLLEHARQESFALSTRPQVEFHTDERLDLGEFGIQAQLLRRARGRAGGGPGPRGAVVRRLRPHDGLLAEPRGTAHGPGAGPASGAARGRGQAERAQRQPRGGGPQPRGGHRARGPEHLAPARRAAARRGRLAGRGSRLDQRDQGERPQGRQPVAPARATRSRSASRT